MEKNDFFSKIYKKVKTLLEESNIRLTRNEEIQKFKEGTYSNL